MKSNGEFCGGKPPTVERKSERLHTAVLEGIAVFFCSTAFYFLALLLPLFNIISISEALVARRAPFVFVGKWQTPQYLFYFWYGQAVFSKTAAVSHELYIFYGSDKQPIVLTALLFEWQTFIGRYGKTTEWLR